MIALVTGASRGIGREVCRQLIDLGFTVLATARDPSTLKGLRDAEPLRLDVTSEADIQDAFGTVSERFGLLDILINNAAITYDTWQRAADADLTVVREAAETNLYGAWRLTQVMLPLLRRSEHPRRWKAGPCEQRTYQRGKCDKRNDLGLGEFDDLLR